MSATRHIPLSQDATLVVALASTAVPFSHSAADEAERWLRVLRLHGHVGAALQALGIGEAPLETAAQPPDETQDGDRLGARAVEDVCRRAQGWAAGRGAACVATVDLLFAILEVYDRLFDRALYERGATRDELLARLAAVEARAGGR